MEQQSLGVLVNHLKLAQQRMSANNPNRLLLTNCQEAVTQLAMRLHDLEVGCRVALTRTSGWDARAAKQAHPDGWSNREDADGA